MAFMNGNRVLDAKLIEVVDYNEGHTKGYEEGYESGKADGIQDEYDRFWDAHQDKGNRTNYEGAYSGWSLANFRPKYSMYVSNAKYMFRMFRPSSPVDLVRHLEECGVILDFSNCENFYAAFNMTSFTRLGVIDISNSTNTMFLCAYSTKLETIEELIVGGKAPEWNARGDEFLRCDSLRNITISGLIDRSGWDFSYCPYLTRDSLTSIINALSSATSGCYIALPKTAVINAFGSTDSDEWINLINTKLNWTIYLWDSKEG